MSAEKGFNGLPSWAKGVIAITGTAIAVFGLYKGYIFISEWKEKRGSQAVSNEAGDDYKDEVKKGTSLTFSKSSYLAASNTIEKLLKGCETMSTEIQIVDEIVKVVKNKADWFYLVSIFGNRDIDDCGWGSTNYDLITLLKDQMDTQLLGEKVNDKMYWNSNSLVALTEYLAKIGVSV